MLRNLSFAVIFYLNQVRLIIPIPDTIRINPNTAGAIFLAPDTSKPIILLLLAIKAAQAKSNNKRPMPVSMPPRFLLNLSFSLFINQKLLFSGNCLHIFPYFVFAFYRSQV